jgi:hypothetical protein
MFSDPEEPDVVPLVLHPSTIEVVMGGNENVSGVTNTSGGKMILQGGSQEIEPLFGA